MNVRDPLALAVGCETYADWLGRVLRAGLIEELVRGRREGS